MTDNTDDVPVLKTTLEKVAIPERNVPPNNAEQGKLIRSPKLTRRNHESIKAANRELVLQQLDAQRFAALQTDIAYSDDSDERYTAQERVAARKWLSDLTFHKDQSVKENSGALQINIRGIDTAEIKDITPDDCEED